MTEPIITCPKCGTEIKLTESLAAPLIESTRRDFEKRRSLFDAQDEVERQHDQLITGIEVKLTQKVSEQEMFLVRWRLQ